MVRNFPCRTHIFLTQLRDVQTSRTRRAQGVCSAHVIPLTLTLSILSCFIHLLCCSRTVTLTLRSRLHLPCRTVPDPKARVQRSSARVTSPRSSTRILLQMETRRLSTIRTTITSLTSRKSHARTLGQLCVSTMLEASVSHVSHGESKESMHRETVARQREREEVLQSRCQRSVDGTVLGVILFRLTENSILMNEISEDILNEELNKLFLMKNSVQRTLYTTGYDTDIKKILERRNSEYCLCLTIHIVTALHLLLSVFFSRRWQRVYRRNTTCTMIIHVRTAHRRCQAQIVAQDTEQKHGKQILSILVATRA